MIRLLKLENWRNFTGKGLSFTEKTFITGSNGVGKSTILEAVRVLSVGKSFRTSRLDELIRFDDRYFRLEGIINNDQKVEFFFGSQFQESAERDRQLNYQGNSTNWADFLGVFPTVLFTPTEMEIVLGGPDVRRRYLDSVLWQVDPNYRQCQIELSQAMKEKAALLFMVKINRAGPDELVPWNELITKRTQVVRDARQKYVDYLNSKLISSIHLTYRFDDRPVSEMIAAEIKTTQNLYGSHRDELQIEFDDFSARRYASRGQSRFVVAHLKAAEADYLLEKTQNPVTILLDDAFSELDRPNTLKILALFNPAHQLVLTSATDLELPKGWEKIKL